MNKPKTIDSEKPFNSLDEILFCLQCLNKNGDCKGCIRATLIKLIGKAEKKDSK